MTDSAQSMDYSYLDYDQYAHQTDLVKFGRRLLAKADKPKPSRYLVLPFSNVLLEGLHPIVLLHKALTSGRSEFCKNLISTLTLEDVKEQYGISWQYPAKKLSTILCNRKEASNDFKCKPYQSDGVSCQCTRAYPLLVDRTIGHVRGMGSKISSDRYTQNCIDKGLNFRPPSQVTNIKPAMEVAMEFWKKAMPFISKTCLHDEDHIAAAKRRFINYCKIKLQAKLKNYKKHTTTHKQLCNDAIEYARKYLALSVVDKAANTLAWECKIFHQETLRNRITSCGNFELVNMSNSQAVDSQRSIVIKHTKNWLPEKAIPSNLAYLTSSTKHHKDPVAYRFLTPMHNCPMAPVSKLIGCVMQHLLVNTWAKLCHEGEESILNTHGVKTRLNWRCASMQEFILNLPDKVCSMWGCDIDQCYEKPPLLEGEDSLYKSIEWFCKECFSYETDLAGSIQHMWFRVKRGGTTDDDNFVTILGFGATSPLPNNKNVKKLKLSYLLRLVRVLFENIIIQVGNTIWRQLIGFPMGCHNSSPSCDIYFGSREYKFIRLKISMNEMELASKFQHANRYQDDVNILNFADAWKYFDSSNAKLWIYPMNIVSIKDTTLKFESINGINTGTELTFLSAHLELINDMLHIKKYEKIRELPFDTVKYTHRTSMVPQSSLYNIIGSQLSTNAMINSHIEYFMAEVDILVQHLLNNALAPMRIKTAIAKWVTQKATTLPIKFSIDTLPTLLDDLLAKY